MRDSIEQRIWNINKDKIGDQAAGASPSKVRSRGMAGNINKCSSNMEQSEIAKLFEGDAEE